MITYTDKTKGLKPSANAAGANAVQLKDNRKALLPVPQSGGQPAQRYAALVQRKVNCSQQKLPVALRQNLVQQVTAYNNYPLALSNTKYALHKQFEMLHNIELAVNTYLKNNSSTISGVYRNELFRILRQAENDHIKLTGRLAQHGHDIWLGNSNLGEKKKNQTQRLWHSLRQNQGNVKIVSNNPAFKNQVLSGYARMLGGNHGRGMLRELNRLHTNGGHADPSKYIRISDSFRQYFTSINKKEEYSPGSSADAYGQVHVQGNVDHQDGTGTGTYVQIQHETPAKPGDFQTDRSGKPLHEPKFITLAHELGHARHNLRGTAGYLRDWDDMDPRNPLHGTNREVERKKWTGSEEFQNITHEENVVRKEHGLPLRKYHATKNAQIAHKNRTELTNLFESQVARVPNEPQYKSIRQQLGAFSKRIQTGTDMGIPSQVNALRADLRAFQRNLPSALLWARRWYTVGKYKNYALAGVTLAGLGLTYAYRKQLFG